MHAQAPHELVAMSENCREFVGRRNFLCSYRVVVWKIILCSTGLFTLLTTDTKSRII